MAPAKKKPKPKAKAAPKRERKAPGLPAHEPTAQSRAIEAQEGCVMDDIVKDVRRMRRLREDRPKPDASIGAAEGCICPPTSEQTCKNPKCPRQDHRSLRQKIKDGGGAFNG